MGARNGSVPRWKPPAYDVRTGPRPSPAVRAAGPALQALHQALGDAPPPCTGDDRWTSDERPDVRHAQAGCQPCHARAECLTYGRAVQASAGTWGGVHFGPRWTRPDLTATTDTDTTERTAS